MSLRAQLSLLYSVLAGVVLLFFGAVVYSLVSVMLVDRVDQGLTATAQEMIQGTTIAPSGSVAVEHIPALDAASTTYIQLWDTKGRRILASDNISVLGVALDPVGLRFPKPVFRDTLLEKENLRVLSVPLEIDGRRLAILQVGTNRGIVDKTQQILMNVLAGAWLFSVLVSGLYGWLGTSLVLVPLEKITEAARGIANKEDLSRRIPAVARRNEIGILIEAFNQTLDRLEDIFLKQKRFIADVSHELRTPLTVIKGNAGLLRRMNEPDPESLAEIENEVDRLTRLVGDLLLLAQAEAGRLELVLQPVQLDALLLEVLPQARLLAAEKVGFSIDRIEETWVRGDRDRLKQVLINLVANAVKYSPAGGSVTLSVTRQEGMADLVIADNGQGIPAKDLPHIFERFYRADKARTRSKEESSYGLGLSIVYWIIRAHGGRIEVSSQEGRGSVFTVLLPLLEPGSARQIH